MKADRRGATARRKAADHQGVAGDLYLFVGARGAVVELEGEPDRQEIEADEAQDRPSAERPEIEAGHEPYAADEKYKENKGFAAERTVRRQGRGEDHVVEVAGLHRPAI